MTISRMEVIGVTINTLAVTKRDNYTNNIINSIKKPPLRRLSSSRGFKPIGSNKNQLDCDKIEKYNVITDHGLGDSDNDDMEKCSRSAVNLGQMSGWVRVYLGMQFNEEQQSKVVYLTHCTTTRDICRDMLLSPDLTLWLQIGGGHSRRLDLRDSPLAIQDDFLKQLGYTDPTRRARLGVDSELRHLIRFHTGPACPTTAATTTTLHGLIKCASVHVLKGLVFPQWRRRSVALIESRLLIYPACPDGEPEVVDINKGEVVRRPPKSSRLLLRVAPYTIPEHGKNTPPRHVFLGFEYSWERDLWENWLIEAIQHPCKPLHVDLSNSGLTGIPDHALSDTYVEELNLTNNNLNGNSLEVLYHLHRLRVLRLCRNDLRIFPKALIQVSSVRCLDMSDNRIENLPCEICMMTSLEELRLDRNELSDLPDSLGSLPSLKTLNVAENCIKRVPNFMLKMRAPGLMDIQAAQNITTKDNSEDNDKNDLNPPLTKVSLRANQLKGNIILGNYGHLTQLDVSENFIETLDLSALDKLEVLQCSRNKIVELLVNGRCLTSLIAGNNELKKLVVSPPPSNLRHFDVSYNKLRVLPNWICSCHDLLALFASHNSLNNLPEHLFCSELSSLHTLQLGYNNIQRLPMLPRRRLPLQEIFLQSNSIGTLPENFFTSCTKLRVLNLSNNRLTALPDADGVLNVEKIYLTANCLTDKLMDTLINCHKVRIVHAAYNCITTLPESCIVAWRELEELVLSGNRLLHLPENLPNLSHLKILRVHSNRLQSSPGFSGNSTLKVLDLAHNQLDRINLVSLVPSQLQFLDLSCNSKLHVDPRQFQVCKSQRQMSLVDVSGRNRATLPSTPWPYHEGGDSHLEPPWKVGFSETAGSQSKLYISQLRLPAFCNTEGLFGIFDGETNNDIPNILIKAVPKILLEERTVKETANDYMKYTLLSAHRELKERGQKYGVCATLCHITRSRQPEINFIPTGRRYVLRVASVGEATAVLSRPTGAVRLTPATPRRQLGNSAKFPLVIPDPEVAEITLSQNDEFLIIANKRLWEVISMEAAVLEVRAQENSILAAKRLQDLAQSYGADDNLSVMIIRFTDNVNDVEQLMRELRQTIRNKPNGAPSEVCQCGCCCEKQVNCCHSYRTSPNKFGSDRSSPSGQSDQANSESLSLKPLKDERKIVEKKIVPERRSVRGVARAVRARIEEEREKEETDSALSEEQFKCWEYMLEQNTQLLFDKELNTLTRGYPKHSVAPSLRSNRSLSSSSPHLAVTPAPSTTSNVPFLSRHFGSARNFTPAAAFRPAMRFGSGRIAPPLNGGANAAYFGSLQRLMPYNIEYDFAVIQERAGSQMDSLEQQDNNRMQQYWGVATTEL